MTKHPLAIALTLATLTQPTIAQIIPDNTTPTTLTTEANLDRIIGQPLTPNATNLLHSFEQFSIQAGHTAQFELPNDTITTILTRITGTEPSQIDGTLIVDGTADLFFLNPNGINFGRDSRVNLGGDLILTTADRIQFGDNLSFSATDTTTDPALLSVLVPTGLQFGENPGAIINRSQTFGADDAPIRATTFGAPLGISVQPDQALLVLSGDIRIDAGSFSAIDGALELVSFGGVSQITLERNQNRYTSASITAETFGTIALSNAAIVDTSGHKNGILMPDDPGGQGGDLYIVGDLLSLRSGAGIDVATYSGLGSDSVIRVNRIEIAEEAGIYINAENVGTSGNLSIESRFISLESGGELNTAVTNSGIGGDLDIQAETIKIEGISGDRQSGINTNSLFTEADAIAGDMHIQANTINLVDGGEIGSTNRGEGQGGLIAINADFISVRGSVPFNAQENQASWISVASEGGGTGSIQLRANTLALDDRAQISAAVNGEGDSQGITLDIGELSITNGAQIIANTDYTGQGGDVTIRADAVTIAGTTADGSFPSGIIVQTRGGAPRFFSPTPADSGDLTLTTDRLTIGGGGTISADTFGTGNAGRLTIAANEVVVQGQAAIVRDLSGVATGTDISISPVRDDTGRLPSRITAFTAGLGNGGTAEIDADQLTVRDGGRIEVGATALEITDNRDRAGNAGNLILALDRLQLDNGIIRADTISGDSGNIAINTADLWLDRASTITTNATGQSTGGNIRINTETLVALQNSDITANAEADFGGQVNIRATGIFGAESRDLGSELTSDITATSALGPQFNGTVILETPDLRADEGVSAPVALAEAPLQQTACDTQPGDRPSEFIFTGRGGLPPRATQHLMFDLDALFTAAELLDVAAGEIAPVNLAAEQAKRDRIERIESLESLEIDEAQGLYRSPQGSIALYAALPPQPITCSW